MKYDVGFIGCGNMGGALLRAFCSGGTKYSAAAYDVNADLLKKITDETGAAALCGIKEAAESCNVLLLAVKPYIAPAVLEELSLYADDKNAVVSVVTGLSTSEIKTALPAARCIRAMPNTPALAGEGMSALCSENDLTEEELDIVKAIFTSAGKYVMLPEKNFSAVTALGGSGPAIAYIFIEALADAGVRAGLARDVSYKIAAQMVKGSAEMVLKTGKHPGELKDAVCTPGGTTIEAVAALEDMGFRAAAIAAVTAACDKADEIAGNAK